jgi:hypothetical protein
MHSHIGNDMYLDSKKSWSLLGWGLEGATLGKRAYSSGKGSTIHPSELPVELKEIPI